MSQAIERKIRDDFSPYLVTARHHHRWMPYRVYAGYAYLGEMCVALAGFGLATPVMAMIANANAGPPPGAGTSAGVGSMGLLSIVLLASWAAVKVYVHRENLEKRCSLRASYGRQCRQIQAEFERVLRNENPMPLLLPLQSKLNDLIDRSIAEDALVDAGIDSRRKAEWESYADDLITRNKSTWKVPDADQRSRDAGGHS